MGFDSLGYSNGLPRACKIRNFYQSTTPDLLNLHDLLYSQNEMKKKFFKSSNIYTIDVTEKPHDHFDNSVTTLNCKSLAELENSRTNIVNELQIKKSDDLEVEANESSDFETAIKATEYGKFNWLLLFSTIWGFMSCMNATTTMSLILPSAECDLNLSNIDKGMLNSIIYIGMIISAFFWGLLSDAVGRRRILIAAFALDAFFSTLVGLAQNFPLLLTAKLFTGFISSGPMAILPTYLAENHSNDYRGSVIICSGIFSSSAIVILPFLAWLIIPHDIRIDLFNGYISLPSWRIFLLVSAIPSILALIGLLFLDESPKFLMFQGNNDAALKVMKKIYKINTGKPKNTFPIKYLKNEMGSDQKDLKKGTVSVRQILSTGWKQMIPIFQKSYFPIAILPCVIQFFTLLGVNTVRLWSPQLFASAMEKEKLGYNVTGPSTICDLLGSAPGVEAADNILRCSGHPVEDKVYFNAMITGTVTGVGYLISGYIVKTWEKKWLMSYSLSFMCCFGLYWSNTSNILLVVISLFVAFTSSSATALISAVIDIFPTSLRTTAVSLCMTFGRMGAMVGNLTFPLLLDLNCTAPFILLAVVILVAATLALLLPRTKGKHLE